MLPRDYQGKRSNDDRHRQSGAIEQNVEQQNVDDNWAEQRQPERDKTSGQTEQTADNLQRCYHIEIMADEQRSDEIASWATRRRRHLKELKEHVQSEKDEHATRYNPSNCSNDLHKMFTDVSSRLHQNLC